ncbi:hypothetical protein L6452_32272 [Arctium lappa]|uniref:Uncharacterized protein n=1 Tax=Arctium lappa TaxID=4217 RepID=A0ACB8Z4Z7_ARCLA|nr:hypothetical protein L6452_32272 [Arctium lappa]
MLSLRRKKTTMMIMKNTIVVITFIIIKREESMSWTMSLSRSKKAELRHDPASTYASYQSTTTTCSLLATDVLFCCGNPLSRPLSYVVIDSLPPPLSYAETTSCRHHSLMLRPPHCPYYSLLLRQPLATTTLFYCDNLLPLPLSYVSTTSLPQPMCHSLLQI